MLFHTFPFRGSHLGKFPFVCIQMSINSFLCFPAFNLENIFYGTIEFSIRSIVNENETGELSQSKSQGIITTC